MKWIAWAFNQSANFVDELSEADFRAVAEQRAVLLRYVEAQETFRGVLDNYSELEVALLSIAQDHIQLGHLSHARAMQQRLLLDRRYANLLSICRLYLNYSCALAKTLEIEQKFMAATNAEYDGALGYRVMEALRNYVQHRGFPLSSITHNSMVVGGEAAERCEVNVVPGLAVERLKGDANFKSSVLTEIESLGMEPDLLRWTREYLDGIRRCHGQLMSGLEAKVDAAVEAYQQACSRFAARGAQPGTIVRYEQRDEENRVLHQMPFASEFIEHVTALRLENRVRGSLATQHVTNALPKVRKAPSTQD